MAHRLPYHTGGCKNIHGHSYSMTVELGGEPESNGMVLDYDDLTTAVAPFVAEIDHCFLCSESDTIVAEFLRTHSMKAVYVDFPTTAENIAHWMFEKLSDVFVVRKNIYSLRIIIAETERSSAEVSGTIRHVTDETERTGHSHQ